MRKPWVGGSVDEGKPWVGRSVDKEAVGGWMPG